MQKTTLIIILTLCANLGYCRIAPPQNLMSPPAARTDSTISLLWDKPPDDSGVNCYEIFQDGKLAGASTRCNYMATNLAPDTTYIFFVKSKGSSEISKPSNSLKISTKSNGRNLLVTDFGAVGDGSTDNTKAIQVAIDACPPGGIVVVPAGTFVSGALFIQKNNLTFILSKNAVLKGAHDLSEYPMIMSRYEGVERQTYSSLINCGGISGGVTDLSIRGPGTIDCQGSYLSDAETKAMSRSVRSHGLLMLNCTNVYLEGFTIQNSPTWCIHPVYCHGLTTENVTINTDGYGVPNADGWDPDSSSDCYLFNSVFSTHDDDIAIKSGADAEGRRIGRPSSDIRITDCLFKRGGGFAIGSEMSGSVSNILMEDCHFVSVDRGFNFKTRRGRGGIIQNVVIKDCTAEHFGSWGFNFEMHYLDDNAPAQSLDATPQIRNFLLKNIVIDRVTGPTILMKSLPESRISGITYKNVTIKDASKGGTITDCGNIVFDNYNANPRNGPVWNIVYDNKALSIEPAPHP